MLIQKFLKRTKWKETPDLVDSELLKPLGKMKYWEFLLAKLNSGHKLVEQRRYKFPSLYRLEKEESVIHLSKIQYEFLKFTLAK